MTYFEECLEKFNALPLDITERLGSKETMFYLRKMEVEYDIDLKFLVVLLAIGELRFKDIPDYLLKNQEVKLEIGKVIKEELINNIFDFLQEEAYTPQRIKEIFSSGLFSIITDQKKLKNFDQELFMELSADENLADELLRTLYANSDKISDKKFVIDGKPRISSIAGWLEYFMKKQGTGNFDKLVIVDFVNNSENSKLLQIEEKRILMKILILYWKLKHFPQLFPNQSEEAWEIIPIDKPTADPTGKTSLATPKTQDEKEIDRILVEKNSYSQSSLEQAALDEEIKRKRHLEDLRIEAGKYVPGSLERMVLEEEISKLEK